MIRVWSTEGVAIYDLTEVKWVESVEAWICGFGTYKDRVFAWEAKPLHQGWYVEIHTSLGRTGALQGATFNLPLEVASAVRRIL